MLGPVATLAVAVHVPRLALARSDLRKPFQAAVFWCDAAAAAWLFRAEGTMTAGLAVLPLLYPAKGAMGNGVSAALLLAAE